MESRVLAGRIAIAPWLFAGVVMIGVPDLRAQDAAVPAESAEPTASPTPEPVGPPTVEPTPVRGGFAGPPRLFLAPTARSLPRGKGSLGLTEIVFPWVEVGLADRVSVGGLTALPLEGISDGGFALLPKIQVLRHDRVQAAVGGILGIGGGIGYGVVTLGSAEAGLTVGYGYGDGSIAESQGSQGVLFMGADKALGRSWRLVVEAYVGGAGLGLPDQTLIAGTRFSRGRWSLDRGILVPIYETGAGTPFPVFAIAWAF